MKRIRMFSFFTDSPDEDKEKVIERLSKMVDMADSCGIRFSMLSGVGFRLGMEHTVV